MKRVFISDLHFCDQSPAEDFFFILALLIGLYSVHRLAMVQEVGEVKEKVLMRELMFEIGRATRNLSTQEDFATLLNFLFQFSASAAKEKTRGK